MFDEKRSRPSPLSPILLSIKRPVDYNTPAHGTKSFKIEGSIYNESMLSKTIIFGLPDTTNFKWCKHGNNCSFGVNCKFAHIRKNNPK